MAGVPVINIPNEDFTGYIPVAALRGQSAYEAAVIGGYTGSVDDFYADLAAIEELAEELEEI